MKKSVLINQPLSAVIAGMGHTDELVIADAGLPIPAATERIDLALTANVPRFLETVAVVLSELQVESAVIAEEMISVSPDLHAQLLNLLGDIPVSTISHEAFKQRTAGVKATVRTGECTSFANVIWVCSKWVDRLKALREEHCVALVCRHNPPGGSSQLILNTPM